MEEATALASVRVKLGHSDGNDVASVVTVRIVPNLLPCALELRPFLIPASRRLEYVDMSVRLLDAMDWFVVESAIDTRTDSRKDGNSTAPEAKNERSDGRERMGEREGRIGGTSSRSLLRVGVSGPSVSDSSTVPTSLDDEATSGLIDRNLGRPTDGGVHRLVLFRVGEWGGRGGECAARLGEDMTARDEELARYGELGGFTLGPTKGVLIGLRVPLPRKT